MFKNIVQEESRKRDEKKKEEKERKKEEKERKKDEKEKIDEKEVKNEKVEKSPSSSPEPVTQGTHEFGLKLIDCMN